MESSNDRFSVERCPICRGNGYMLVQIVEETSSAIIKHHEYVDCTMGCDHGFVNVLVKDINYDMGHIRQDFMHVVMDNGEAKISINEGSTAHHRQLAMAKNDIDTFEKYCIFTMSGGEEVRRDAWIHSEEHEAMLEHEEADSDWLFEEDE